MISPCERLLFPHNDHTIRSLVFPARLGLARTALLADCSFPKGQCDFAWFENPLPSTTAPPIEATVHRAAFGNAQINLVLAENPLPPVRFGVLTAAHKPPRGFGVSTFAKQQTPMRVWPPICARVARSASCAGWAAHYLNAGISLLCKHLGQGRKDIPLDCFTYLTQFPH